MSSFDIPNATQNILIDVATAWANGQLLTTAQITSYLNSLGAQFTSKPVWQTASIASGEIVIERQSRFTYADLRNEGLTFTDDLTTITPLSPTVFEDGDFVILRQAIAGQETRVLAGVNVTPDSGIFTIKDNYYLALIMQRSGWVHGFKYPNVPNEQLGVLADDQDIDVSVPASLVAVRSKLNAYNRNLAGETLATADVTITAASGTAGGISVHVDYGFGPFKIGEATYSSATTVAAVLADLETSIDTGGSGFTASVAAPVLTASAPVGSGASGDNIIMFIEITGGIAATSDTSFSGGVDAPEADAELDTVLGMGEGKLMFLKNAMANNGITINPGNGIDVPYPYWLSAGQMVLLVGEGANARAFFSASQTRKIVSVTATYTVLPTDEIVRVDATAGAVTINLPLATDFPEGKPLVIKKYVVTVNAVTLDGNGTETIDGALTSVVVSCTTLYRVGNAWEIQSQF